MKAYLLSLFGILIAGVMNAQQYADELLQAGPCKPLVAVTCPSGVQNPLNLVDNDQDNFATMVSVVGTSLLQNTAFVELGFSDPVAAGSVLGLVTGELDQDLNIDVLQQLRIIGFDPSGQQRFAFEGLTLANVGLVTGDDAKRVIQIPTELGNYEIRRVRIEFTGLLNVSQKLDLFSLYAEAGCPPLLADAVVSSENVTNPQFAVGNDQESAAILDLPLGLLNSASLHVQLQQPAAPGQFVGFEVNRANILLGLGVIENLSLIAYDNQGEVIERKDDFKLTDLVLLESVSELLGSVLGIGGSGNTRAVLGFHAGRGQAKEIASIEIVLAPTVGVLVDLLVYSAFSFNDNNTLNISSDKFTISSGQNAMLTASGNFDSYVWSNGEVGRVITINEPGVYRVTATRFDGCELTASILIRDADCNAGVNPYATRVIATGACDPILPLLCPSGVENAENAVDGDPSTFATLVSQLGVNLLESKAFIELGFDAPQAAGSNINFIIQPLNQNLNVDVMQQVTVTAFDENDNVILVNDNISFQDIQLISESGLKSVLTLKTPIGAYKIARVRFEIEALANVLQDLALYDMYTDCSCPSLPSGQILASENANNTQLMVDGNPNSFGTLDIPLGIAETASVDFGFADPARSGDFVGCVIGANNELLDAGVISELSLILLDENGTELSRLSDFSLADLVAAEQAAGVLGGLLGLSSTEANAYVFGGVVPEDVEEVAAIRLEVAPVIGALVSLRVYSGFYQEVSQAIEVTGTGSLTCAGNPVTLTAPDGFSNYLWSNGETTNSISVDEVGVYTVTVSRASGCPSHATFVVNDGALALDAVVQNSSCNTTNGGIAINILNGSGSYKFAWSNGDTTASLSNVGAGQYTLQVSDLVSGCSFTETYLITDADAPKHATWVRHANCGSNDGAIFLTLPEGASVQWSNGETTPIIRNLAPGVYLSLVTFANGCKRLTEHLVISRSDFQLSAEVSPSLCNQPTGGIAITIGVAGDYVYEWSNGFETKDLVGLAPGVYTLVVTNIANGCQDIINVALSSTGSSDISLVESKEETCARDVNGVLEIAFTTVGPNPQVEWNTGQTTARIENLGPGLYTVKVSDDVGCEAHAIYPLVARDPMITTIGATNSTCNAPFDGTAFATADEGRAPYDFVWSNGEVGENLSGLEAGLYSVQITDFNGCMVPQEVQVNRNNDCKSTDPDPRPRPIDVTEDDINNIYTPNGDGKNDTWVLGPDLTTYDAIGMRIVNIYGDEVFSTSDYNNEWDGTYRNSNDPLPEGTYYFQAEFQRENLSKTLTGFVTLKR